MLHLLWLYHSSWILSFSSSLFSFGLPSWLRWWRICLQCRRPGFDPWVRKSPWRRERLPTPVFLLGVFHWQGSLVGYSAWGHRGLDMTEWLMLLLSLSAFDISIDTSLRRGIYLHHVQSTNETIKVILHFCYSNFHHRNFFFVLRISISLLTLPICSCVLSSFSIQALSILIIIA